MADTLTELHAFAQRLGMRREWYQDHPIDPHYDLVAKRRAHAVELGAVEVNARARIVARRHAVKCEGVDCDCWVVMIRTSGDCRCETCGREHRRHPWCANSRSAPSLGGEYVLHVLCDGTHVKL